MRTTDDLERAARSLHQAAREHKRAEFRHRKEARALMRQIDALRVELAHRGIALTIDDTAMEAKS